MEAAHVELGTDRLMCTQERTGDEIDTDLTLRLGTDGAAAAWVGGRRQRQHVDRQHFEPEAQGCG
jgi:hypothetical protein